ncbi:MAG: CoA-binding protein [Candidatus Bathyarchaeia archaeon]
MAVVGASRDSSKPAHYVPKYLRDHRYDVLPLNPLANEIHRQASLSIR